MKRKIIIAPYLGQRVLFDTYRKDNIFADIKFITKEELLANFYYDFTNDSVKYLIKKYGYDFQYAARLLKVVSYLGEYNLEYDTLFKLKDELIKNELLSKNDLFKYELQNSDIYVHYYFDDPLIDKVLNGYHYQYVKESGDAPSKITSYEDSDQQLYDIFNKIEDLLSKGVPSSKIFLYGLIEDDETIFDRLKDNYHINFNNAYKKSYISLKDIRTFVESYSGNKEASKLLIPSDHPQYEEIISLIDEFYIEGIDATLQKDIYRQIFTRNKVKEERFNDAINVLSAPIIKDDEYLFIINYAQGIMPLPNKDDDVIDDEDKTKLGIFTSKDINIAETNYLLNTLHQKGHIYLSYPKRNFSNKLMASPLKNNLKQKEEAPNLETNIYSLKEAKLQFANKLDLKRKYLHEDALAKAYKENLKIDYRGYDSQISPINHFSDLKLVKLSYSSAKTYFECRYKYYLSRVARVDELEESFNMIVGNIAHSIMENASSKNSYDELFDNEVKRYDDSLSSKEKVLLRRIKEELRKTYNFILEGENQVLNHAFFRERYYTVPLTYNILLEGKIDKIILSGDKQKYISIVDYKTGSETFKEDNVKYGLSLQLPTYALLAKKIDALKEKEILMLAIQPLLSEQIDKASKYDEDKYYDGLKAKGIYLNDLEAIKTLEKNLIDKPKYLGNISITKSGTPSATSKLYSKAWFDELSSKAYELIVYAGECIQQNDFKIDPKLSGGKLISCDRCPFKDICYMQLKDAVILDNDEEQGE